MKNSFYQNKFRFIVLFSLINFSSPLFALDLNQSLKQAQRLMEAEKIEAAFDLLNPIADDNAGNAKFDYFYGLLLQKMEQHSYAVLVLERALFMQPKHVGTQIALAKGYIQLKEFSKATKLQQQLEQQGATAEAIKIEKLTQSKEKEENKAYSLKGFIKTSFSYDDNLTSGPDSNFLIIPGSTHLGPVAIGQNLEKDQDFFYTVSGYLGLKVPVTQDFKMNVGIWGSQRFNRNRPDEDLAYMSSWAGGSYQQGKNNLSLNFKYQSIWIDDQHYQNQYAILGQWYRPLFKSNALAFNFNVRTTRHPGSNTLNYDAYTLGAIFYQQLPGLWHPMLSLEVYGGEEKFHDTTTSYLGHARLGTRLVAHLHFNKQNTFLLRGAFEDKHYKQSHPFFLGVRHDQNYSVTGKYTRFLFERQLELSAEATWILNSSNMSLYDYQRNIVSANIQWNF